MNADSWVYHNSHELEYREPFGAVESDTLLTIRVRLNASVAVFSVILRIWNDGQEQKIPMTAFKRDCSHCYYQAVFMIPSKPGLVWYYFIIQTDKGIFYYCNNDYQLGGVGQLSADPKGSYQVTVFKAGYRTPDWFKDSIMYQIFVDRFCKGQSPGFFPKPREGVIVHDSWTEHPGCTRDPLHSGILCNDFFGGNLPGIIEKLPYLKELGITVLYLNPIFEAASNHKYDTGDYKNVDPMFGNDEIFKTLCEKAKELGISVILDGVFSHTGSDSVYFNKEGRYPYLGAFQSKESPYYSWYRFYQYPNRYDCWWGIDTLPNTSEMEPSYLKFVMQEDDSVIRKWIRAGASGWRLDVVDELPDEFLKELRRVVKSEKSDAVIIGEVWEDASNKFSYGKMREFLWGEELDSAMNYPFRKALLSFFLGSCDSGCESDYYDAESLNRSLMSIYENYPIEAFYSMMNLIGSHDVTRAITLLEEAPSEEKLSKEDQARYLPTSEQFELGKRRLKLLSLVQMTFPGVPCIYYGDEAGLGGHRDPFNRRPFPWGKEDKELLEWYKRLAAIRNKHQVLRTGEWNPIYHFRDIYGYIRRINGGRDIFGRTGANNLAIVLVNRSRTAGYTLSIDLKGLCSGPVIDVLSGDRAVPLDNGMLKIHLSPLSGKLLLQHT